MTINIVNFIIIIIIIIIIMITTIIISIHHHHQHHHRHHLLWHVCLSSEVITIYHGRGRRCSDIGSQLGFG